MAELKPGVIGTISGKIGNVVASNWRDIKYLRGVAATSSKTATEAQLTQRAKFTLLFDFLSSFAGAIDLGYKYQYQGRSTAFNLAMSTNMHVIGGTLAALSVDYPSVVISKGRLLPAADTDASSKEPGVVDVSWQNLDVATDQGLSDKAVVIVYNPVKKLAIYSTDGAVRGDLKLAMHVPDSFSGDEVHVYLFFSGVAVRKNSQSMYVGSVSVF